MTQPIFLKRTVDNSDKGDDSAVHDDIKDLQVCNHCGRLAELNKESLLCPTCHDKARKGILGPVDVI